MMRRTLANMASFYTEQLSVDVREGLARRVQTGLFTCKAPYGYVNVRRDGRSIVEVDPIKSANIRIMFDLYANEGHTFDSIVDSFREQGVEYTRKNLRFNRSKLNHILQDRSYIGEVQHKGHWYPGVQEPIVDRAIFDRVQKLLGNHLYR